MAVECITDEGRADEAEAWVDEDGISEASAKLGAGFGVWRGYAAKQRSDMELNERCVGRMRRTALYGGWSRRRGMVSGSGAAEEDGRCSEEDGDEEGVNGVGEVERGDTLTGRLDR